MNYEKKITAPKLLQQQKGQSNDLYINSVLKNSSKYKVIGL
jgi:hypothetical protein